MTRLPDWRARLAQFLGEVARRPFRPGHHDCALFAAGAVAAMTGEAPAAAYRGRYVRLGAGRAMLRARGVDDHLARVADLLPEVTPAHAQVGDVAALDSDLAGDVAALGIVQGPGVYVLRPEGLAVANRLQIKRAFHV